MYLFTCFVCWEGRRVPHVWRSKGDLWSWFSPFTLWVPVIELRSGLVARAFHLLSHFAGLPSLPVFGDRVITRLALSLQPSCLSFTSTEVYTCEPLHSVLPLAMSLILASNFRSLNGNTGRDWRVGCRGRQAGERLRIGFLGGINEVMCGTWQSKVPCELGVLECINKNIQHPV